MSDPQAPEAPVQPEPRQDAPPPPEALTSTPRPTASASTPAVQPPPDFRVVDTPPSPASTGSGVMLWVGVAILALLLFAAPFVVRSMLYGEASSPYVPPATSAPLLAMTPEPTATPWAVEGEALGVATSTRPVGPVVIDYAHYNQMDARGMQPLAAALSRRGLSTRVWLTEVDAFAVTSSSGFPDQSKELAEQLRDASAMIIISPYFYWTAEEIALLERFVADGGRLLLISDPDIYGDAAVYMNLIAEPFGVVFNDDYLYDTVRNDENFTHFFQGQFLDQAAALDGLDIAFYGGRSISGDVVPQAVSASTTLSSRRTGVSGFTTVAIGDNRGWESAGRVLALSDFDVLTEPNVVRHDNQQIVEFVADFLAAAERNASLADFPAWLDRDVTLMIGSTEGLNADTLLVGAKLQRRLEETGRQLTLAGAPVTTGISEEIAEASGMSSGAVPPGAAMVAVEEPTLTATPLSAAETELAGGTIPLPPVEGVGVVEAGSDVILLADYDYANEHSVVLPLAGITLEIEYVTPTPSAASNATSTPAPTATSVVGGSTPASATPAAPLVGTETPPPDATVESPSTDTEGDKAQGSPPPVGTPEATVEPDGAEAEEDAATPKPGATATPQASTTPAATATATPTVTPTPIEVLWLVAEDGLRLLANETVLIIRTSAPITEAATAEEVDSGSVADTVESAAGRNAVVVLGSRASAIHAGVERLLEGNFTECITGAVVTYCPIEAESGSTSSRGNGSGSSSSGTPTATSAPGATVSPVATTTPGTSGASVLLIDDNASAEDDEESEADHYLRALAAHGISPVLWTTSSEGIPTADQLKEHTWVIWSNAGYARGELPVNALDPVLSYINEGGRLTVSSRIPFFAMGTASPSAIRDVAVVDDVVALSQGLYSPVNLTGEPGEVAPLAEPDGEDAFDVTLVRGSSSDDPESPAMVSATDEGEEEETGAKLIIVGMSVGWLPADFANQLVANMADWMLEE